MGIFLYFTLLLAGFNAVLAGKWKDAPPVEECTHFGYSPKIEVHSVELDPKCGEEYCEGYVGDAIKIKVSFTPLISGTDMIGYLFDQTLTNGQDPLLNLEMPFHTQSICNMDYNISCPFKANERIYAHFNGIPPDVKIPVHKNYPVMTIKGILRDQAGTEMACYKGKVKAKQRE